MIEVERVPPNRASWCDACGPDSKREHPAVVLVGLEGRELEFCDECSSELTVALAKARGQ